MLKGIVSMIALMAAVLLLAPLGAMAQDPITEASGFWSSLATWVLANGPFLFTVATSLIGVFALVATRTPNTSDDKIVDVIYKLINFFGANLGKAKNDPSVK